MLGALGTLRIRTRSTRRLELALTRVTHVVGWTVAITFAGVALWAATISRTLAVVPMLTAVAGLAMATMRQRLVFDREDGVLRMEQRLLGIPTQAVIPLFHLRAVVVRPRLRGGFVAVVERRVGEPIVLDNAAHPGRLYALAQAIAEVAQLRLIYDATSAAR